jgi:adenylate kinase family enzyme
VKPRIHIIGGPGSGKTYVASLLAERFGIRHQDLDEFFWDNDSPGYGVRAETNERDRKLAAALAGDGWIVEGVYYQWVGASFDQADIIIALVPSMWVRHFRIVRRFILRKFNRLPNKKETLRDLWKLILWGHAYDRKNLTQAREFIGKRGRKIVTCRSLDEAVKAIKAELGQ